VLTDKLGVEVVNEGTFKRFILYMKKNYIKMNPDEKIIKGMTGKKKSNCKLVRAAFKETVDALTVDMSLDGMLDYVYDQIKAYEKKFTSRQFSMDDIKITQALSKDIEDYKSNTPLVQAARNMMDALDKKGTSRNIGRKGVIIEYVKTDRGTRWMPTQLVNIDDVYVEHYIDQLHRVFRQLTVPLGMADAPALKESKEQGNLGEWF
jgi:DNA polymerase elongation subunit (family B)